MTKGYLQKKFGVETQRFVQTLDLDANPEMIAKYRKWHSEEYHRQWKEVREGIRAVGILEMELYIIGNRLVMIVDAPAGWDWDTAMQKLATLPRQAEWEAFMSQFQGCNPEASSDEKWQMMERMFYLYD